MENQENLITDPIINSDGNNLAETDAAPAPTDNNVAAPTAYDEEKVRQLVEEAEKRGYLKGRNEQIEEWLKSPESNSPGQAFDVYSDDESCPEFLAHIRPGFWD